MLPYIRYPDFIISEYSIITFFIINSPKYISLFKIGKESIGERRLDNTLEKHFDEEFVGLKEIKEKEKVKRTISEPSLISHESMSACSGREKHRHRRTKRSYKPRLPSRFGYEIADLDAFLTKVLFIMHF